MDPPSGETEKVFFLRIVLAPERQHHFLGFDVKKIREIIKKSDLARGASKKCFFSEFLQILRLFLEPPGGQGRKRRVPKTSKNQQKSSCTSICPRCKNNVLVSVKFKFLCSGRALGRPEKRKRGIYN